MKKGVIQLICTFVLIAVAVLSSVFIFAPEGVADANSAWYHYEGVNSVGAIVKSGNCPVVVDREDLTFDIYKDDGGHFYTEYEDPKGKVSAKYTFRNPDDTTAVVGLLFPFGFAPEHGEDYREDNKKYYSVKVGGEDIDKRIRYTYKVRRNNSYGIMQFHIVEDRKFLSDEYINATGLESDKTVYKYTCTAKDGSHTYNHIDIVYWDADCRILCAYDEETSNPNGEWRRPYDEIPYVQVPCDKDGKVTFYTTEKISYSNVVCRAESTKHLPFEYVGEVTLEDAVMSTYDESDGIEKVDWYNAFTARACSDTQSEFINLAFETKNRFRWYDYTLTFAPGETIINEVVAPMYPCVTNNYTPLVYKYTYLLSPARTWASFGEFHLRINTDMYVKDASVGKLKKHKGYYEYSCNGLPANELTFNVCASAAPITRSAWWGLVFTGIGLAVTSVIWLPILIVIIVKVHKKRKLKKAMKESQNQPTLYVPVPDQSAEHPSDAAFEDKTLESGVKSAEIDKSDADANANSNTDANTCDGDNNEDASTCENGCDVDNTVSENCAENDKVASENDDDTDKNTGEKGGENDKNKQE